MANLEWSSVNCKGQRSFLSIQTRSRQAEKHRPYHSWQLLVFRSGFHVKSGRFHVKSTWHSLPTALHETEEFSWNLWFIRFQVDFTSNLLDSTWNPPDFTWNPHEIWQISPEIHQISWNPPQNLADFMWNPHEIHWIPWNPPDFHWIPWNPPDFMKSAWNQECELLGDHQV